MKLTLEIMLGAKLRCVEFKFEKNLTMLKLNNFKAILSNTFFNFKVDILINNFKLTLLVRLIDKPINLSVEYQVTLILIGVYLVYLQKLQETSLKLHSFFYACK
jgi:hypothetical protein